MEKTKPGHREITMTYKYSLYQHIIVGKAGEHKTEKALWKERGVYERRRMHTIYDESATKKKDSRHSRNLLFSSK